MCIGGKGKLMWQFSTQRLQISTPCLISVPPRLLALPTEAWLGAEIHICLAENGYIDLPRPCPLAKVFGKNVCEIEQTY
jgi:hypothetical protein